MSKSFLEFKKIDRHETDFEHIITILAIFDIFSKARANLAKRLVPLDSTYSNKGYHPGPPLVESGDLHSVNISDFLWGEISGRGNNFRMQTNKSFKQKFSDFVEKFISVAFTLTMGYRNDEYNGFGAEIEFHIPSPLFGLRYGIIWFGLLNL